MPNQSKQTKFNFYSNIIALVANIIVGIYYTPYLISSLGLSSYGVLPLALIINQYISVATQTLTHAYTRFYSVALQKGNYEEASKDISTSFVVVLLVCFILIPIGIIIITNAEYLFVIPEDILTNTKKLFGYTIISFLVSLFSSLMNVTLYATNRLDLMNLMKIIRIVFKLGFLITMFEFICIDVSFVGLSNLLTEILILGISFGLFVKFKPKEIFVSFRFFDKKILVAILGMSVWVLIQLCGDTLLYRTDNLILNHYWGTIASGALGAISEIGSYVSVMVSVLGSLFGPLILTAYAKGNHDEVKSLFIQQSTIVGCLSAVLTGVISGCGFVILNIWLGHNMGDYQWWLLVKMYILPFYAAGGIFALVYRSWNKMKISAIGSIVLGIINIIILISVCRFFEQIDVIWILIIGSIFSISQCYILNGISVASIYDDCKSGLLKVSIKIIISFVISFGISSVINWNVKIDDFVQLIVLLVGVSVFMIVVVYNFILSTTERQSLKSIIV